VFSDEAYVTSLIHKQNRQQCQRLSSLNISKYNNDISNENYDVEFMLIKWCNSIIEEAGTIHYHYPITITTIYRNTNTTTTITTTTTILVVLLYTFT